LIYDGRSKIDDLETALCIISKLTRNVILGHFQNL